MKLKLNLKLLALPALLLTLPAFAEADKPAKKEEKQADKEQADAQKEATEKGGVIINGKVIKPGEDTPQLLPGIKVLPNNGEPLPKEIQKLLDDAIIIDATKPNPHIKYEKTIFPGGKKITEEEIAKLDNNSQKIVKMFLAKAKDNTPKNDIIISKQLTKVLTGKPGTYYLNPQKDGTTQLTVVDLTNTVIYKGALKKAPIHYQDEIKEIEASSVDKVG